MDNYVIMGVDPGNTTGVFVYFDDGFRDFAQLGRDEVAPYFHAAFDRWARGVWGAERVFVSVERYIITAKTAQLSQQPDALEITGLVKGLAQLHSLAPVRQHMKANLKYASDPILRSVGWLQPGMRHANDAARQAFATLKAVDYPRWSKMIADGTMSTDD